LEQILEDTEICPSGLKCGQGGHRLLREEAQVLFLTNENEIEAARKLFMLLFHKPWER